MEVNMNIKFDIKSTQELEWYIKSQLPEIINENIFKDVNTLKKFVDDATKSFLRAEINNLMQGKEFREYLRDFIWTRLREKTEMQLAEFVVTKGVEKVDVV